MMFEQTAKKRVLSLFLLLGISCLMLLTSCTKQAQPLVVSGFYFDTCVSLTLYEDTEVSRDAAADFLDRCAAYEQLFSKNIEGSDIWRINHANGAAVTVSDETAALLTLAKQYAARSGGAALPTIGTVSALWDFHAGTAHIPSKERIADARNHIDISCLQINGREVRLTDPDMQLDPGFIAKGYIADRLKDDLLARGIESGIINLGGNVAVLGEKPDGQAYTVGIEKPFSHGTPLYTLSVRDTAVVTSGVYERYFYEDTVLYHHILDPATGFPVANDLYSVTIVCKDAAAADALSTACFVLGIQKGLALIEETDGAEALFLDNEMNPHPSSGFPKYSIFH